MLIPKDIGQQSEIQKIEIPSVYANKRIIGISTIIQELANNYLNGNVIWSYYSRDQLMIYSNSRELRKTDMDEVQRWILSLLKLEERPTIRALKTDLFQQNMIIPKDIGQQSEKQKIEIPNFYANKRIIGISIIIQELANNYLNENAIWKERPTTQALKTGFILAELLTRYCKLIGHKYPDHKYSKCNGEDNIITDVQLE
ncbi:hypothetical protein H5410_061252 [Solanum commersonii]|uniref:Uncharacterized protein n=1 Tax=Solanum commersonii TaxID=4109 RepID=A0A9J5W925_SOLCO|nr:hypothetical protein H5410_061252 [Solanum commersonii]